ncbi:MAG: FG-GAP-like repeat-containing protein, partial [Planctomycetota bacterium]
DDEDGVLNPLDLIATTGTTPEVTLLATNTTGQQATLVGWIDYDRDGNFENGTERALLTVPDGTTNGRLTLTFPEVPADAAGRTYARFRLSTDSTVLDDFRMSPDGEVEDYAFEITAPSNGLVKNHQKISDGVGGFAAGELDENDHFGSSVASVGDLDGDGVVDLVVGAGNDDDGSPVAGAVYVLLMNSDGSVKGQQKISNGTGGLAPGTLDFLDSFGRSVSSIGDLDGDGVIDLAVGADGGEADGNMSESAVFILLMNADGTVKSHQEISDGVGGLAGATLDLDDRFGSSVTSVGDLDGDGVPDLAVGATGDDDAASSAGAVYVLLLNSDGTVKEQQKITDGVGGLAAGQLDENDHFGSSVANVGDLDGDGIPDLAVGAFNDDDGNTDAGAVYMLLLNADGTIKSQQKVSDGLGGLAVGTLDQGDFFGRSLSTVGDLDGDGISDIAVGADGDEPDSFLAEGAVYVLLLNSDGTVKVQQKISDGLRGLGDGTLEPFDFFGRSVSNAGDIDGDGVTDLAVGAQHDDDGNSDAGAVYVLFLSGIPQAESLILPSGGSHEVLRDGVDLVLQVSGGAELFRETASLVSSLTITGSADADQVTVLDFGTAVETPLVFSGGNGDDSFDASLATGAVNLSGNGGDDVLIGGSANDTLNGGSGKDELVGNAGNDRLQGQGGTGDTLDGGDGDDTLNGGSGNDLIRESFDGDAVLTSAAMTGRGNDTVIATERVNLTGGGMAQSIDVSAFSTPGLTSATLNGAGGDDSLTGSNGSDVIIGAGGNDLIDGGGGNDRLFGGSGADTLTGGVGNDLLKGLGGSGDRLQGGDGNDTLNGGRGIDRVVETGDVDFTLTNTSMTGLGTDVVQAIEVAELIGGDSDNTIDVSGFLGFRGFTLIRANGGDDSVIGSAGPDVINGGDGNDTLLGKAGNDTLNGDDGNDGLSGFDGDDVLNGGRGFDRGFGGVGNDTLTGGNAVDTLIGGDGDDNISGNDGNDILVGGTGNNDASMGDVISDGTANIDEAFT